MGRKFTRPRVADLCKALLQDHLPLLTAFSFDAANTWRRKLDEEIYALLEWEPSDDRNGATFRLFSMLQHSDHKEWIEANPPVAAVHAALVQQSLLSKEHNEEKTDILRGIGYGRSRDEAKLQNIPVYRLNCSDSPTLNRYPLPLEWYAPSEGARTKWLGHFAKKPADIRKSRKGISVLDPTKFAHIVLPDEDAIFVDEATGQPVLIVIRDWVRDKGLLEFFSNVITSNADARRNVRVRTLFTWSKYSNQAMQKEDAGKIVLAGYSAGSLRKALFGWARNVTARDVDRDEVDALNMSLSSIFALYWKSLKECKLEEARIAVEDLEEWIKSTGVYRMDGNLASHPLVDSISITVEGRDYLFNNVELAPPSAVCAINYAR
jgi:hypothetical protein